VNRDVRRFGRCAQAVVIGEQGGQFGAQETGRRQVDGIEGTQQRIGFDHGAANDFFDPQQVGLIRSSSRCS
jgi:hypothetical protein